METPTKLKDYTGSIVRARYMAVGLTVTVGIIVSLAAFVLLENRERHMAQIEFQRRAGRQVARLQETVHLHLEMLQSVRRFYNSSREVNREEFHSFVSSMFKRFSGIEIIAWLPRIDSDNKLQFIERAKEAGIEEFRILEASDSGEIVPAAERDEYYPVYYIEPISAQDEWLGIDLASSPQLLSVMQEARDWDKTLSVPLEKMLSNNEKSYLLYVVIPVFLNNQPHDTIENRRENLQGYLLGVYRMDQLLHAAIGNLAQEIIAAVQTVHIEEDEPQKQWYVHNPFTNRISIQTSEEIEEWKVKRDASLQSGFAAAGRRWIIFCVPSRDSLAAQSWTNQGVLFLGLLSTFLLGWYLYAVLSQAVRAEQLLARRTNDIQEANEKLEKEMEERIRTEEILRKSESRFKELFHDAPIGYHEVDKDGIVLRVNQTECNLFGYTEEEMMGTPIWKYFDPPEVSREAIRKKIKGEIPPGKELERKITRKDGTTVPILIEDRLIYNETGEVVGIRSTIQDITKRKQAEEKVKALNQELEQRVEARTRELARANLELSTANKMLREMDRIKSSFIDLTSHELRTPVTAIGGMLRIIEQRVPESEKDLLSAIKCSIRGAVRLEKIVLRTLKIVQLGRYETQIYRSPTNLNKLIDRTIEDVIPFVELRRQQLKVEVEKDFPKISIDREKIHDVMLNLLMNAIKFTPNDGEIRFEAHKSNAHSLTVKVTDTGIGIPDADKPFIFDEFFTSFDTLHHSTGDYDFETRGIGLGLSIVKKLVEMHGGEVGFESHVGKGSTFYFSIPVD